jgi:hypothetical protein
MQVCLVEIDAVAISGGAAKTFCFSDVGYTSLPTDPSGPTCYLPYLDEPLQIDRELPISPESQRMVGATWGDITIMNPRDPETGVGFWDATLPAYAVSGRGVRVKIGFKTYDSARGIWLDPPLHTFLTIFSGQALDWVASPDSLVTADEINVRIRDNLASLENPLQTKFYSGAGGVNGNAQVAGQPVPKLRGTCKNVTPTFIDTTNLVYQLNDQKIQSVAAYDGGLALTLDGDSTTYAALTSATIASGHFRTCVALGLIRLGASPAFALTADATGFSADGVAHTDVPSIALALITNDAGYSGSVDTIEFAAASSNFPAVAGFYSGAQQMSGVDFLSPLLASAQLAIGTETSGMVSIFNITPPETYGAGPIFNFGPEQIIDCQSYDLDASVITPNWRRTLSYAPNDTVQTTLAGAVGPVARQFQANSYSKVVWANAANLTKWPLAEDAPLVVGRLQSQSDAQNSVNLMGALWGKQRFLFDITLPLTVALQPNPVQNPDLGIFGTITFPAGPLAAGPGCFVVGHNIDAKAKTVILRVFL